MKPRRSGVAAIWRGLAGSIALATATAWAVPPPPAQLVAACDAPSYAIDQLVCGDAELRAMDQEVREMLSGLAADAVESLPPFVESQREWFARRSLCAFEPDARACTQDAYAERMAVLGTLGAGVRPDRTVRCTGELAGSTLGLSVNQNLVVLTDPTGRVVLIALEPDAHSPWRAFVEVSGSETRRFTRVDGQYVSCR